MSNRSRRGKNRPSEGGSGSTQQHAPSPPKDNPLAKLPEKQRQEILQAEIVRNPEIFESPEVRALAIAVFKSHSGPLPPPEDYQGYEDALPGSCDRILAMAEKAQTSMIELNNKRIDGDQREAGRGQICALLIALSGITAAAVTSVMGVPWQVSVALCGGPLALVIAPFFRKNGDK